MFTIEYIFSPPSRLTGKLSEVLREAASLAYLFLTTNHTQVCGGALIQLQHVLAPASCISDEIKLSHYLIKFGMALGRHQYGRPKRKNALQKVDINIAVLFVSFSYTILKSQNFN